MQHADTFDITDDTEFKCIRDTSCIAINSTVLDEPKLSWKAKGIHLYLQSKLIPGEEVDLKALVQSSTDGYKAVLSGMRELQEHGYVRYTKQRNTYGEYVHAAYKFFCEPIEVSRRKLEAMELLHSDKLDLSIHSEIIDVLDPNLSHSLNEMMLRQVAREQEKYTQESGQNVSHKKVENEPKSGQNKQLSDPLQEKTEECPKTPSTQEKHPETQKGLLGANSEKVNRLTKNAENALEGILKPIQSRRPFCQFRPRYKVYNALSLSSHASACSKSKRSITAEQGPATKNFFEKDVCREKIKLEKKKLENTFIPLLDLWNKQPHLPNHKVDMNNKLIRRTKHSLLKVLLHCSVEVVVEAILNYEWILAKPFTRLRCRNRPVRVGIDEFFKFTSYSDLLRDKEYHPLRDITNWFDECRKGKDYLLKTYSQIKKDNNPEITSMITSALLKSEAFAFSTRDQLQPIDQNTLICISLRMVEFIGRNKNRLPRRNLYNTCIREMVRCLESNNGGRKAHAGYLANDIFWRDYELHLRDQGIFYQR